MSSRSDLEQECLNSNSNTMVVDYKCDHCEFVLSNDIYNKIRTGYKVVDNIKCEYSNEYPGYTGHLSFKLEEMPNEQCTNRNIEENIRHKVFDDSARIQTNFSLGCYCRVYYNIAPGVQLYIQEI